MTTDLDFPPIDEAPAQAGADLQDVAEIRNGTAIVRLSRTEAGLAALRDELQGRTYDLTTTKGNEAARADRLRCVTLRTSTEKLRKALKAPALEFGRLIDAEAARITQEVQALETPIDAAIRADENRRAEEKAAKERALAERLAGLRSQVDEIMAKWLERCEMPGMTSARISAGIHQFGALAMPDELGEVQPYWQQQHQATRARMTALGDKYAQHEEAARLEAIRQENQRQAEELARARAQLEAQAAAQRAEAERLAQERAQAEARAAELAKPAQPEEATQPVADAPEAQGVVAENHAQLQPDSCAGDAAVEPGPAVVSHQAPACTAVAANVTQPAQELTDLDRCRMALADACDLLAGWIATKCPKKHVAEHMAHVAKLREMGGLPSRH